MAERDDLVLPHRLGRVVGEWSDHDVIEGRLRPSGLKLSDLLPTPGNVGRLRRGIAWLDQECGPLLSAAIEQSAMQSGGDPLTPPWGSDDKLAYR